MLTYIALSNFTDQGLKTVKDSSRRAQAIKKAGRKFGATMTQIDWAQRRCGVVAITEAPDEACATAFALAIGMSGNIRTQTLRACTAAEMKGILGKRG